MRDFDASSSHSSSRSNDEFSFFIGQWLDVQDPHGSWLEAQVIDLDAIARDSIRVHYKGWKSTFDESIFEEEWDERVAALHTHTHRHPRIPDAYGRFVVPSVGLDIDVLDSVDRWCEARVVLVQPGRQAMVHYHGWSDRFNEWLPLDSYRIAPLHSRSTPRHVNVDDQEGDFSRPHTPPAPPATSSTCQSLSFTPRQAVSLPKQHLGASSSSDLQRLLLDNERAFRALLGRRGAVIVEAAGDGNCMFSAVSHQLYGDAHAWHSLIRAKCMDYMVLEREFFQQWIADEGFDQYIARMRCDGQWGDHVELTAISEIYERPIYIYAYKMEPVKVINAQYTNPPIHVSYHLRSHYNSVMFPDHQRQLLTTMPGEYEDSKLRLLSLQQADQSLDTQSAALRAALTASRAQLERSELVMVDAAVEASMLDESRQAEEARQLAHAQQVSAAAVPVINEEDDELQRALALSMQPDNHAVSHSTSVPTASAAVAAADEESLAVALRESEQGFLQTLPLPVRRLHIEFKVPLADAQEAYAVCYCDSTVPNDELLEQRMLSYLADF